MLASNYTNNNTPQVDNLSIIVMIPVNEGGHENEIDVLYYDGNVPIHCT